MPSRTLLPLPFLNDVVLGDMATSLANGRSVTASTGPIAGLDGTPVFSRHVYVVDQMNRNAEGKVTSVRLYNPHGSDFGNQAGSGANDGFFTITANQFYNNFLSFDIATA